jgi:hypothetical protein
VDGCFAHFCGENEPPYTDDVADVEQPLEYRIVHGLVFTGTYFIAVEIQLYPATVILKLGKGCTAHDAPGHDATGKLHVLKKAACRPETAPECPWPLHSPQSLRQDKGQFPDLSAPEGPGGEIASCSLNLLPIIVGFFGASLPAILQAGAAIFFRSAKIVNIVFYFCRINSRFQNLV